MYIILKTEDETGSDGQMEFLNLLAKAGCQYSVVFGTDMPAARYRVCEDCSIQKYD